jgi:putative hydrolase
VEPIDALRKIAFLLERENESSYRVESFRRADATLASVEGAELRRLANAGQLQTLDGIGKTTAAVILEALSGRTPSYLAGLEQRTSVPVLNTEAEQLRAALRGDCHAHTEWSDGGNTIEEMAKSARDLGLEYIVITDHSPRLRVANGLTEERLRNQLAIIRRLNKEFVPFRILTGIEVDILDDGALDQTPDLLAELDIVVGSVHSKLRMESEPMTERMVNAVTNPNLDILGHCTGRMVTGEKTRLPSDFDAGAVFAACAETGTAVEINCRPERLDPPGELIQRALTLGCSFSIGTDAHAPGQLSWAPYGCERAERQGITPDMVVNTRPVDALLDWARS